VSLFFFPPPGLPPPLRIFQKSVPTGFRVLVPGGPPRSGLLAFFFSFERDGLWMMTPLFVHLLLSVASFFVFPLVTFSPQSSEEGHSYPSLGFFFWTINVRVPGLEVGPLGGRTVFFL